MHSMMRVAVMALLLAVGTQAGVPGELFNECNTNNCFARCLEFVVDPTNGLGFDIASMGLTLEDVSNFDLSETETLLDTSKLAELVRSKRRRGRRLATDRKRHGTIEK